MGVEFVRGTKTLVEIISQNHGAIRVPLAQNFDYTPAFEERRIFEFDRADAVAVVTNFNGVNISFTHLDSDSQLVDSAINDLDPAAAALVDDPSEYKEVNMILNIRSPEDNKIFQSVLVKKTRLNGAAATEPVRNEGQIARSGVATNVLRIKKAAIEYNRLVQSGSAAFSQGSANSRSDKVVTLTGSNYEATTDNTPQTVVATDSGINNKAILYVLKNGEEYTGSITLSGSTIQIPETEFDTNDVFEVFTTYLDV